LRPGLFPPEKLNSQNRFWQKRFDYEIVFGVPKHDFEVFAHSQTRVCGAQTRFWDPANSSLGGLKLEFWAPKPEFAARAFSAGKTELAKSILAKAV